MKKLLLALSVIPVLLAAMTAVHAQNITTIAGNGMHGYGGDGGPATVAYTDVPDAVAADSAGNLYVVCRFSGVVKKIDPSGIISNIAGLYGVGSSGDGGPATAAFFNVPGDVKVDRMGNIYICDIANYRIRKIDTAGIITTIAGTGTNGHTGDGGPATAARITQPYTLALDNAGNIYFPDGAYSQVRKVTPAGIISVVAGDGVSGYTGDGGSALTARLTSPCAVATDNAGNLYIGCNGSTVVRKVNAAGIISTVAGSGTYGYTGDHGPAVSARLEFINGLAVDNFGDIYIADYDANCVRKVDASGIITTIAGTGAAGFSGDGGPAVAAQLNAPYNIYPDPKGNVYIADGYNNRVRKIADNVPSFTRGNSVHFSVCENMRAVGFDSLLSINDADTGQVETWSLVTSPASGSVATSLAVVSTGGVLLPSGFSYTPIAGFAGEDSFTVNVNDGSNAADTMIVYVTVHPVPAIGAITGPSIVCPDSVFRLSDTTSGGIWSSSSSLVAVSGDTITSLAAGDAHIVYSVSNAWCAVKDSFSLHILTAAECDSATAVPLSVHQQSAFTLAPNPNNGIFSFTLHSDNDEPLTVAITNILGKQLKKIVTTTNRNTNCELDAPAGIYFMSATSLHGSYTSRIVITR